MSWMTRFREYMAEVRVETGKVSWPTRLELRDSTIVVIVTVILVTIFIAIVDQILNVLVKLLFGV
jgi:preprotein translocase subunit SecE